MTERLITEEGPPITSVDLIPPAQLDEVTLQQVITTYAEGYQDKHKNRWVGEDDFLDKTMPNTTSLLLMKGNDQIAGVINLNCARIIAICVNNNFRGKKLGPELFRQAELAIEGVWITIDIEAEAMLWTVTTENLRYKLIENIDDVADLFSDIKGVHPDDRFNEVLVQNNILTRRFRTNPEREFMAFTHTQAYHGPNYRQFVFRHNP